MEVSGQLHAPAVLLPEKEPPVPTEQEAGWAPKPVWKLWSIGTPTAPAVNRNPVVEPVARRYTGYATRAPK
jgi:hypothetical protein